MTLTSEQLCSKLDLFFLAMAVAGLLTTILYTGEGLSGTKEGPSGPNIKTPFAKIEGIFQYTRGGRTISAFKGIRYAEPPEGKLRFARPMQIKDDPERVIYALDNPPMCFQRPLIIGSTGQEDCLFLNVYVPDLQRVKNGEALSMPVIVYIHAGGFVALSSNIYDGHYFLDRDVIFVTMNYRLGPLGFLNLGGTEDGLPAGNQALWDQLEVLKWVKRNIKSFGGDPENVTIMGSSAGAICVIYHLISEKSKGFFNKAVITSGSLRSPSMRSFWPIEKSHREYAKDLGCSSENLTEVANCLTMLPVDSFLTMANQAIDADCSILGDIYSFPFLWFGSIDGGSSNPFFGNRNPKEITDSGKIHEGVPILIGFDKEEGLYFTSKLYHVPQFFDHFKQNLDICIARNILGMGQEEVELLEPRVTKVIRILKKFYFEDEDLNLSKHFTNITNMFSDAHINYRMDDIIRKWHEKSSNIIYYYVYMHKKAGFSLASVFGAPWYKLIYVQAMIWLGYEPVLDLGVAHSDDIFAIFLPEYSKHIPKLPLRSEDIEASKVTVDLFVNFAQFGKPVAKPNDLIGAGMTPESLVSGYTLFKSPKRVWKPYGTRENPAYRTTYIRLNDTFVNHINDDSIDKRLEFWYELAKNYPDIIV